MYSMIVGLFSFTSQTKRSGVRLEAERDRPTFFKWSQSGLFGPHEGFSTDSFHTNPNKQHKPAKQTRVCFNQTKQIRCKSTPRVICLGVDGLVLCVKAVSYTSKPNNQDRAQQVSLRKHF